LPDPGPAEPVIDLDPPIPTAVADPPPPAAADALPRPDRRATNQATVLVSRVPRTPTSLKPQWLLAAVGAGVVFDVALRQAPWNNVAGAALILTLAAGLLISGFVTSRSGRLLVGGAAFLGLFVALRTEPILVTITMLTALGLLALGAIHGQGRPFWDFRPLRLLTDGAIVVLEGVSGVVEVPAELEARYRAAKERADGGQSSTVYAVLRGLAIALPIVLLFGVLLASADVVFESFFSSLGAVHPAALIGHLVLIGLGAYTMMVLLRLAAIQGSTEPINKAPSLGHIEAGVVLGAINLLFAAFAVAQLMTVLGGAEEALDRAGLDSKHFARQGFFQLLWVAGLTLGLLMMLHVATSENQKGRGVIRLLSLLTVGLTLLIVAVALTRIGFYIGDGGLTPLRLYAVVASLWIASAFVLVACRVQGYKPNRAWLMPALLVSALVTIGGLNVINPERIVALDNLNRDHDALLWHIREGQFSGDGNAVLAAELDRLSPERAEQIGAELCRGHRYATYPAGLLRFNLGDRGAERELSRLCSELDG
jgi:hypothetical protein